MKKKAYPPSISHDTLTVARLKRDPEFAVEYLKVLLRGGDSDIILAIS